MKFSKTRRDKIERWAKNYFNACKEKFIDNPDFEICMKKVKNEFTDPSKWKCNTCEYKEGCAKGEELWVENENVIEELIDGLLNGIEKTEEKKCRKDNQNEGERK